MATTDTKKLQEENAALQKQLKELEKRQSSTNPNDWLPADTAKQYKVVGWSGNQEVLFPKFGIINLATLTHPQAERLIHKGFTKLQKK